VNLEYRKATSLDVRYPERVIDLIAVPYNEETRVLHHGRWIVESIAPGSFAGVKLEDRHIIVNRGHDTERPLGKVFGLHPNNHRGLRTEIKIVGTPAGDEVLELAAEELLGASVGFAPYPGGETYSQDRTRRTITRAFLGHIALTGTPAYEGAQVLAVRSEPVAEVRPIPTPNLDRVLSERRLAALGVVLPAGGDVE
jgi:HK97 family phage prohead protease